MRHVHRLVAFGLIAASFPLGLRPAKGETLAEAIAMAYQANPTLQSQRAQLRALDETYVQAEAGWRPTISATAEVSHAKGPQNGIFGGRTEEVSDGGQLGLSASQPLYTGGRVAAQVDGAEAQIRAGREQLRATEATVLQSAIQAYLDVVRDRASLKIQRDSLAALQDACDEIKARYEAGANTSTDVAQAQAQLEAARALVVSAQAQAEVSVAEYVTHVGQSPGELAPAPRLAAVPKNVDEAFDAAEAESPTIRQAKYTEASNRAKVQEARAAERPTVAFNGSVGETSLNAPFDHHSYDHAVSVGLQLSQPIFTGGTIGSQIRQAVEQDNAARIQVDVARRQVIQSVAQAWSQGRAAHANVAINQTQVKVAQAAYDGMREEYRAGLRQTLDVLIAQQTLRDAQIALVQAEHDDYLAETIVLQSVGRLEARVVVQGVPLYQPQASFRKVEDAGATPIDALPRLLDHVGAPGLDQPRPLTQPDAPDGPVRMTPATETAAPVKAHATGEG